MTKEQTEGDDRARAARRNLARLEALAATAPGLVVAAIAADLSDGSSGDACRPLPLDDGSAAAIAELPGVFVWVWPSTEAPERIAADLARARAMLGEATRAVLVVRPRGKIVAAPLPGEMGAWVAAIDTVPLIRAVGGLSEAELVRGVDVTWSADAQAHIDGAGFVMPAPRA